MTALSEAEIHRDLSGFEENWRRDKDPFQVWMAIKICSDHGVGFPGWVTEYLTECAVRVIAARDDPKVTDAREVLPGIFQFIGKPHLANNRRDLAREQYAMRFAAAICDGKPPTAARKEAAEPFVRPRDDRTYLRWLSEFFGLTDSPDDNATWRNALNDWFRVHPLVLLFYQEEHPSLPTHGALVVDLAKRHPGARVVVTVDGTIKVSD